MGSEVLVNMTHVELQINDHQDRLQKLRSRVIMDVSTDVEGRLMESEQERVERLNSSSWNLLQQFRCDPNYSQRRADTDDDEFGVAQSSVYWSDEEVPASMSPSV